MRREEGEDEDRRVDENKVGQEKGGESAISFCEQADSKGDAHVFVVVVK